jgi:hypothetical protein
MVLGDWGFLADRVSCHYHVYAAFLAEWWNYRAHFRVSLISETIRVHLVLFSMQNRTCGPYLAAINRTLISPMPPTHDIPGRLLMLWVYLLPWSHLQGLKRCRGVLVIFAPHCLVHGDAVRMADAGAALLESVDTIVTLRASDDMA